jgi:bifunctional UDP-N-acetylglucosamine pyrophosphorylase/glucosamine-1-phosphate N-acetyltransferase
VLNDVPYIVGEQSEFTGVNTLNDLSDVESIMQRRLRLHWQDQGVYFASDHVSLAFDTQFGKNTIVHPFVTFGKGVVIGDHTEIFSHTHIEDSVIGSLSKIGPFAHIKGHSHIHDHVHVGNFVEIKKSILKNNAKIKHLSYIGDATIGQYTNIGAGTITCNYDGVHKHPTVIGDECFIGANSTIIAPIHLKSHCKIAAGSVITEDVPEGGLAFGRARQVNKKI